jgi:ABC-type transport system involved in multi-copper enzyme maturation permease subunit
MKFLATLKDSLREALDLKIFYVLVVLSFFIILLVASISFEHEDAKKGLERVVGKIPGQFQTAQGLPLGPPLVDYSIEKFENLQPNTVPWEGNVRFQLVVQSNTFRVAARVKGVAKEVKAKRDDPRIRFRVLVQMDRLLNKPEAELEPSERQLVRKLRSTFRPGGPPDVASILSLDQELQKRVENMDFSLIKEFIARQLLAHGSMEVTSVKKVSNEEDASAVRYLVEGHGTPQAYRIWPTKLVLLFGAVTIPYAGFSVGGIVHTIQDFLVGTLGAGVAMLIATIVTAFFIPNMLRKGSVDLLIAKPIHRTVLLIYKFIGGLTFMFLNTVVIVVGIWVVLGMRSGLWAPAFLISIFTMTYQFAIFYAVSTFFGVLTRTPIVSILTACAFWALLWIAGNGYVGINYTRQLPEQMRLPEWVYVTSDTIHLVLPHYKDLDALTSKMLAEQLLPEETPERQQVEKSYESINWTESLVVTSLWIALFVGLACLRFSTKDY